MPSEAPWILELVELLVSLEVLVSLAEKSVCVDVLTLHSEPPTDETPAPLTCIVLPSGLDMVVPFPSWLETEYPLLEAEVVPLDDTVLDTLESAPWAEMVPLELMLAEPSVVEIVAPLEPMLTEPSGVETLAEPEESAVTLAPSAFTETLPFAPTFTPLPLLSAMLMEPESEVSEPVEELPKGRPAVEHDVSVRLARAKTGSIIFIVKRENVCKLYLISGCRPFR